jgi:hypothetical protein
VLVADVARFERIGLRLHLQDQIDNIFERNVGLVWPVPAAPADVIANAILGNIAQRMIERLDLRGRPLAIAG